MSNNNMVCKDVRRNQQVQQDGHCSSELKFTLHTCFLSYKFVIKLNHIYAKHHS